MKTVDDDPLEMLAAAWDAERSRIEHIVEREPLDTTALTPPRRKPLAALRRSAAVRVIDIAVCVAAAVLLVLVYPSRVEDTADLILHGFIAAMLLFAVVSLLTTWRRNATAATPTLLTHRLASSHIAILSALLALSVVCGVPKYDGICTTGYNMADRSAALAQANKALMTIAQQNQMLS